MTKQIQIENLRQRNAFIFMAIVLLTGLFITPAGAASKTLTPAAMKSVVDWFSADNSPSTDVPQAIQSLKPLEKEQVGPAAEALWKAYRKSETGRMLRKNLPAPTILETGKNIQLRPDKLKTGEKVMPFVFLGKGKLDGKRPLFIALHGGGSAGGRATSPHAWPVNTREWNTQAQLAAMVYPDNALYFVPRMADDNDGRWYYNYCQDAYDHVVRAAILHYDVDPDRVYIIGISEGAYTAYRLGAFMADRWAGAGSMAGGEPLHNAPPANMRNIAFRADIGEKDTMFDRVGLNKRYGEALTELKKEDSEGFDHVIKVHTGRGHGIDYKPCPEWLFKHKRNPWSARVRWDAIEVHERRKEQFYWLAMDAEPTTWPVYIDAQLDTAANTVNLTVEKKGDDDKRIADDDLSLRIYLNDEMLNLDRPVTVIRNGKQVFQGKVARRVNVMLKSLAERGDPSYVFPAEITLGKPLKSPEPKAEQAKVKTEETKTEKSNEQKLMESFPEDTKRFAGWILRRAGDNRETVAKAILEVKPEYRQTALSILVSMPKDELVSLGQAALTKHINTLAPVLALIPQEGRHALAGVFRKSGDNRDELIGTLKKVSSERLGAALFLLMNMPQRDLTTLKQDFLVEQVELACDAWEQSPWHKDIPEQIFMQYILPYANLNERRDNWRRDFMDRLKEKAWSFKSPVEATIWLNTELNDLFKVYYHATKRPKADQSPYESIEAGYASCTGLSILLADACRSVGIPARIVGVPRWTEVQGNHNWVEIWDGQWHNVGGTGSDPRDDDWVNERCQTQTDPDQWIHSVYAACFRQTPLHFPLVWDLDINYIPALNITRFYMAQKEATVEIPGGGKGVAEISWAGEVIARKSGEKTITFTLAAGSRYQVTITTDDGKTHAQTLNL